MGSAVFLVFGVLVNLRLLRALTNDLLSSSATTESRLRVVQIFLRVPAASLFIFFPIIYLICGYFFIYLAFFIAQPSNPGFTISFSVYAVIFWFAIIANTGYAFKLKNFGGPALGVDLILLSLIISIKSN